MNFRILSIIFILFLGCKKESNTETLPVVAIDNTQKSEYDLVVYNFEEFEKLLHHEDGKTYIVNFWATWCAPCIKELPYFERINESYKDKNVEVLLVSLDFPKLYEKNLIPYIKKNKLKSKVVALNDTDSNAWIPKVNTEWSGAIPATLIYNKDKRQFYEQSFNFDELKTEVEQFLN